MSFFALVDGQIKVPESFSERHPLFTLYEADIDEGGVILLTPVDHAGRAPRAATVEPKPAD